MSCFDRDQQPDLRSVVAGRERGGRLSTRRMSPLGSLADLAACSRHVRFTPDSGD